MPLAIALLYALGIVQFPLLQQVLHPLFAFALVWSLAGTYLVSRGNWSGAMPGDAGVSAGLEFCRREIERRQDFFRRVLLWLFGPVMLAIGTFVLALAMIESKNFFPNAMPFMVLVALWIAVYFFARVREQGTLRREIDELNDIERENSR